MLLLSRNKLNKLRLYFSIFRELLWFLLFIYMEKYFEKFQRNNLLEEVNGLICQKKYLLKLLLVQQLTSLPLITCLVLLNLFF